MQFWYKRYADMSTASNERKRECERSRIARARAARPRSATSRELTSLGSVGVPGRLVRVSPAPTSLRGRVSGVRGDRIALHVVARGGDVVCQFLEVAGLVALRTRIPRLEREKRTETTTFVRNEMRPSTRVFSTAIDKGTGLGLVTYILLLLGHFGVHGRGVLRELAKRHAGILTENDR